MISANHRDKMKSFLKSLPTMRETGNMGTPTLYEIGGKLNELSKEYPIGELQDIRKRRPGNPLFRVTDPNWAFHLGGRTELQFHIGLQDGIFSHGVAFSFKDSRSYTLEEIMKALLPKVPLFNKFVRRHRRTYADMRLSIWDDLKWETVYDQPAGPIPVHLLRKKVFVHFGKEQPVHKINYDVVLKDLSRLPPLYRYIESYGAFRPVSMPVDTRFCFRPGGPEPSSAPSSVIRARVQEQIRVERRHEQLQQKLCRLLIQAYGPNNVGWESPTSDKKKVDVTVQRKRSYWFYEIKIAGSVRECIRQALGQILEYAFWKGGDAVTRLVIVGEYRLDVDTGAYLHRLRKKTGLPLEYEQVTI